MSADTPSRAVIPIRWTYVELVGVLAHGGVVLLDEEPANLIFGVAGSLRGFGGNGWRRVGWSGSSGAILLLVVDAVRCHRVCSISHKPNNSLASVLWMFYSIARWSPLCSTREVRQSCQCSSNWGEADFSFALQYIRMWMGVGRVCDKPF